MSKTLTATEQRAKDAAARVEGMLDAMLTGDAMRDYLTWQAQFHSYSWNNVCLILAQKPDATQVAGFRTWQKMGRQVRKGEKGIAILAPVKWAKRDEDDEDKIVASGTAFRAVAVFDVSQTDGEAIVHPLRPAALLGDDPAAAALTAALVTFARDNEHLRVELDAPHLGGAKGSYLPGSLISIAAGSAVQVAKTMSHEVAHHLAGHDSWRISGEDRETVAELAAYIVMDWLGIDTSSYSVPYVAGWAGDMAVVRRNLAGVQKIAAQIIAVAVAAGVMPAADADEDTLDLAA